ncbi:MAG: hypothetical protein WCJ56_06320 [bacterium]
MRLWNTIYGTYRKAAFTSAIMLGICISASMITMAENGITSKSPNEVVAKSEPNEIAIIPAECCNLHISDNLSPTRVVVDFNKDIHNYFAGWFTGLPLKQPITIGFS